MANAANPEEVNKQARKERDIRKQELNDIATVLSSKSGQRLIWRILGQCGTFRTVFNPENPHTTSYLSGQQDLGHFIMREITYTDPNLMIKLMKLNKPEED